MPSHVRSIPAPPDVARLGLLIALAGALQAAEGFLPTPAPWFRVGFGNALVLVSLLHWGPREGVWVALGKVLVGSLLGGRFLSPAFALSLGGSLSAAVAMALAARAPSLGFVGLSVVGAQAHALAQLGLASLLLRTPSLLVLAPLLSLFSIFGGVVTGFAAEAVGRALDDVSRYPPATGGKTLKASPSRRM